MNERKQHGSGESKKLFFINSFSLKQHHSSLFLFVCQLLKYMSRGKRMNHELGNNIQSKCYCHFKPKKCKDLTTRSLILVSSSLSCSTLVLDNTNDYCSGKSVYSGELKNLLPCLDVFPLEISVIQGHVSFIGYKDTYC